MDVEEAAEELYALPPAGFTARRAELASQARREGASEAAKEIAALRRPTVSSGLINQLVRDGSRLVDRLQTLGERLRAAQADLDGGAMRELTGQRHELVAALVRRAGELAEDDGQKLSGSVQRELEETFGAAVADEQASLAVTSGRLTRALVYAGFGEVDVAAATATPLSRLSRMPRPGSGSGTSLARRQIRNDAGDAADVVPPPGKAPRKPTVLPTPTSTATAAEARAVAGEATATKIAAAEAAAESARAALREAEDDLSAAERRQSEVRTKEKTLSARLDELQREILTARHELDAVSRRVASADRDQQRQARRVEEARRAEQRAGRALDRGVE